MKNTASKSKRKVNTKQSRSTAYDKPTNLLLCLQQVRAAQAHHDSWLVATCQHIAMRGLDRQAVTDILRKDRVNGHLSDDDCYSIAGRLVTLSRNEDALMDLKYGTQPIARRITLKKKAM